MAGRSCLSLLLCLVAILRPCLTSTGTETEVSQLKETEVSQLKEMVARLLEDNRLLRQQVQSPVPKTKLYF
jgi:hypothetical protein